MLDNFANLQASWVTQGGKVGQLSLAFGANDMGSVMIEENVVRAAGAAYCMDELEIVRNIEDAGFTAVAADHALRPARRRRCSASARCRGMLELATAREAGDTSVPGGAGQLPGAQRGRQAPAGDAALAGGVTRSGHDVAARQGRVGLPDRGAAAAPTAGSWSTAIASPRSGTGTTRRRPIA